VGLSPKESLNAPDTATAIRQTNTEYTKHFLFVKRCFKIYVSIL